MKPTLVVLAAGMGSRYGGIKQIEAVGPHGESLIDYSIHNALKAGFGKIVLVVRSSIEAQVRSFFEEKLTDVETVYVNQELDILPQEIKSDLSISSDREKPWGTGQALWICKSIVKEPFAMINGDDYYAYDALKPAADFLTQCAIDSAQYAVMGYRLDQTLSDFGSVSRGICQVENGDLVKLEEHTKIWRDDNGHILSDFKDPHITLTGTEPVSMNLFAFTPVFMQQLHAGFVDFLQQHSQELKSEFFVPKYLGELIQTQKARCSLLTTNAQWFGITYKEDTPRVKEILKELHAKGEYPDSLY